jgi:hypothetical protein
MQELAEALAGRKGGKKKAFHPGGWGLRLRRVWRRIMGVVACVVRDRGKGGL